MNPLASPQMRQASLNKSTGALSPHRIQVPSMNQASAFMTQWNCHNLDICVAGSAEQTPLTLVCPSPTKALSLRFCWDSKSLTGRERVGAGPRPDSHWKRHAMGNPAFVCGCYVVVRDATPVDQCRGLQLRRLQCELYPTLKSPKEHEKREGAAPYGERITAVPFHQSASIHQHSHLPPQPIRPGWVHTVRRGSRSRGHLSFVKCRRNTCTSAPTTPIHLSRDPMQDASSVNPS